MPRRQMRASSAAWLCSPRTDGGNLRSHLSRYIYSCLSRRLSRCSWTAHPSRPYRSAGNGLRSLRCPETNGTQVARAANHRPNPGAGNYVPITRICACNNATPSTSYRVQVRQISHVGTILSVTTCDRDNRHRAVRDAATAQVAVTVDQDSVRAANVPAMHIKRVADPCSRGACRYITK